jgi:hypothetical protein
MVWLTAERSLCEDKCVLLYALHWIVLFQPDFLLSVNGFMDLFSRRSEISNLDEKELVQPDRQ